MISRKFSRAAALAVSTSVLALGISAQAQTLDEVVVTAQKKSQNLQDVPVAITAFDFESLEKNRIEGIEDIGTAVPGLYVTQNPADPNGVRVSIRGVGTFDPQVGQDSRVAIYQDGIYLGKTQGLAFDMPDLARIEVLKGPQGTLYGRNTVAGAINLISAKPDPSGFSGKANAELGNFDHRKVSGAVNVPLGESAAARISASFMEREGWVENSGPGTNFGGEEKFGMRGAIGFDVGDRLNLEMALDYNKTQKQPLFYQSISANGSGLFANAIPAFDNGREESTTTSFSNESGELVSKGASVTASWDLDNDADLKIVGAYRETDSTRFVALVPNADPAIINQTIGGFNQALGALPFAFGATGQPLRPDFGSAFTNPATERGLFLSPPGGATNLDGHKQFSLEATYNGSFADGAVDYTGGAFYYDEQTGTGPGQANPGNANDYLFVLAAFNPGTPAFTLVAPNIQTFLDTVDLAPQFPGVQALPFSSRGPIPVAGVLLSQLQTANGAQAFALLQQLVGSPGSNPLDNAFRPTLTSLLGASRQTASNTLQIDTQAFAIYGQATWNVSDTFRITGGLRYSDESKDGDGQVKSPFFNDNIDLLGNLIQPLEASFDDQVLDPSLTLEWDAREDVMLYASYKESFRSGGFNASAVSPRSAGQTFGPDFTFGREDITAYEVGMKGDFNNRFRLNAAAFYYDFTNKQTTFALNPLIATERAIVNTDDEIYGIEFDSQFAINDFFTLKGSYTYIDGTAGDTVNPNNPADIRSFPELQGTPKNSYLIALDYDGELAGRETFATLSFSHKDDVLSIPENNLRLPAIDLVSGRVGMDFDMASGNTATVALWGTNLLDEEYLIDSLPFETFAHRTVVYGQPRSYGISAGVKF